MERSPKMHATTISKYDMRPTKRNEKITDRPFFNFPAAIKEHGYVKARQMLKQMDVYKHQEEITKLDADLFKAKEPLRLKEAIKLSYALGEPSSESVVDKILLASNSANETVVASGKSRDELIRDFDVDVAVRRSLIADDTSLIIPQMQIESLPLALGDTLFLQTGYLKALSLPRNKLASFLSFHIPQLSMFNFRYLRQLNLSGNNIKYLPPDIGKLAVVEDFNLSRNALFKLPRSFGMMKNLKNLDLSYNSFSNLDKEIENLLTLEKLNLSGNLYTSIPSATLRIKHLKVLNLSRNAIFHTGMLPPLLHPEDLWNEIVDEKSGKKQFVNILTRERVRRIHLYSGTGIARAKDLHSFQTYGTRGYRRRKIWLSICQVNEWDVARDPQSGWEYYQNNVSGETQWEMPTELDIMGKYPKLEELHLSNNIIKFMPSSIGQVTTLKRLYLQSNRLHSVGPIGTLTRLEILDAHDNELKLLPIEMCECSSLQRLHVQGNVLLLLPKDLGLLPQLEKVEVWANSLTYLPFSLGYCTTLKELIVHENPLVDPPMAETNKGLDHLRWYLRSRMAIDERGLPPAMKFHDMSIQHEVTIIQPELKVRIARLLELSRQPGEGFGFLNLQLMGITEFPRQILKHCNLAKLLLDFNDHFRFDLKGIPKELAVLKHLSFRNCKIPSLPDNINELKRLVVLNLEENRLEMLPASFTKLRNLQNLGKIRLIDHPTSILNIAGLKGQRRLIPNLTLVDVSKNRLYDLPAGFDSLKDLQKLNLEGNCLEVIPESFERLSKLEVLLLNRNRFHYIPDSLCSLTTMRKLCIECNDLVLLPERIRIMHLQELRVGHNQIESLADNLFDDALGQSLKVFTCTENNIMELPLSLHKLDPGMHLEADFNPLVSPPAYLLPESLALMQNYMRIREFRLGEIEELLGDEDFEFDRQASKPVAGDVLLDGMGFLSPDDLSEFDRAVQEYVNGEFFRCPASGEEIVEAITKLRDSREDELYLAILNTMLDLLVKITEDKELSKLYSDAVITTVERSWGRGGEKVKAWAVSLSCLLTEAPSNFFQRNGRPSLYSMIEEALPEMAVPFTVDLLKDALRIYVSPYGQVADTCEVTFKNCDCIDDVRHRPLRHSPCDKAAVVLSKSIYSAEEAVRRDREEDIFMQIFEDVEEDVRMWLITKEGKKETEKQIKVRMARLKEELSLKEDLYLADKQRLNIQKAELKGVLAKKELFDKGESELSHGFKTEVDALQAIEAEQLKLSKLEKRLQILDASQQALTAILSVSHEDAIAVVSDDLVQKYCFLEYEIALRKFRKYAAKRGLRRPWDGEDGVDYRIWYDRMGPSILVRQRMGQDLDEEDDIENIQRSERPEEEVDGEGELKPEYDWFGCEKMEMYTFDLYTRYASSHSVAGRFAAMMG